MLPQLFETDRCILRAPRIEDAEDIFAYARLPEVTRYLTWREHQTIDETVAFIRHCNEQWQENKSSFPYIIVWRETQKVIGTLGVRMHGHGPDIGYALNPQYHGKGIMPEVAGTVTEWLLQQPDIYRVWAVCDTENPASARVMEKIGMQREGILRRWGRWPAFGAVTRDCWCYAKIRE